MCYVFSTSTRFNAFSVARKRERERDQVVMRSFFLSTICWYTNGDKTARETHKHSNKLALNWPGTVATALFSLALGIGRGVSWRDRWKVSFDKFKSDLWAPGQWRLKFGESTHPERRRRRDAMRTIDARSPEISIISSRFRDLARLRMSRVTVADWRNSDRRNATRRALVLRDYWSCKCIYVNMTNNYVNYCWILAGPRLKYLAWISWLVHFRS